MISMNTTTELETVIEEILAQTCNLELCCHGRPGGND